METFFEITFLCLLTFCLGVSLGILQKMKEYDEKIKLLHQYQDIQNENVAVELENISKDIIFLSEKILALPDILKEDIHRTMLSLKEALETNKPIKPNNWDSFREAFKGSSRVDIDVRN